MNVVPISGRVSCVQCGKTFAFCSQCVSVMIVDPVTKRPPDVDANGNTCKPDPAVMARSVAYPLCVPCTKLHNARLPADRRVDTEADRHALHVGYRPGCRVIA